MGLGRLGKEPLRIEPAASVADAVEKMVNRGVGAIAVCEGKKIVGIFTERDLMRRVVHAGRDLNATPVAEVMSSPVHTALDQTRLPEAAAIMERHHIRHLPIVDEAGDLTSIVALRYILFDLTNDLERKVDSLESYIMADSLGG